MLFRRTEARDRSILITGATGGLGCALAAAYAGPGITLLLHGRNAQRLSQISKKCRELGAVVVTSNFDIRDVHQLVVWLQQMDYEYRLDLVFVNAGINISMSSESGGELWEDLQALLAVNVNAAITTVHALMPAMRARGSGQVAIISSLAAWRGLPETPGYSASKAAVKAYGEAMRDAVAADGVRINVIMPGYVESQMAYDMPGPKPFMWTAERAALFIKRGLQKNRARISFPFPLNFGCWILAGIHPTISGWILKRLNYGR